MTKEVMKQALEALEQWNTPLYKRGTAIETLRQAIAEAEKQEQGEPVAYLTNKRQRLNIELNPKTFVQMPTTTDLELPLFMATKPQTKEWVGLTYEEVQEILLDPRFQLKPIIAHAVEAKLKEKNT